MARSRANKSDQASADPVIANVEAEQLAPPAKRVAEAQLINGAAAASANGYRQMLIQGWSSIAAWMTFGLLIEGLLGYKVPAYLLDNERRELFRLAHTHGTILGLLLVAAALCGQGLGESPPRAAIYALRAGTVVMPLGFLIAGIWHYESDPGLAIWLVPPAALLLIFGVIAFALACRAGLRRND